MKILLNFSVILVFFCLNWKKVGLKIIRFQAFAFFLKGSEILLVSDLTKEMRCVDINNCFHLGLAGSKLRREQ